MTGRYRNSALRVLRYCHFAYAQSYVYGHEGLPSPDLRRGQNVHAAIGEVVARVVAGVPIIDIYEIAARVMRDDDVGYQNAIELLIRFQEALGTDIVIDPKRAFLLEEVLEMPIELPDGSTAIYYGTPDLGTRTGVNSARIEDWKTHWRPETEDEFLADPQLPRYALLLNHHFPALKEFELKKWFVRYRNNSHSRRIDEFDLEQVRLQLAAEIMVARDIERTNVFVATGGAWCTTCQHHAVCPVIKRYREQGIDDITIDDDERAREVASDIVALEAASDALKKRLKTYLGGEHANGYVPVPGGTFGFGVINERDALVQSMRAAFEKAGAQFPEELLKINLPLYDKLRRQLPDDLAHTLEGTIVRSESTRFQFRKSTPVKASKKTEAAA